MSTGASEAPHTATGGPAETTERAVIDAFHRAVVVSGSGGEILLWNRAAEELYGWSEEMVLGRSILDVLVPSTDRDLAGGIFAIVAAGKSWRGDFTIERRDGKAIRVHSVNQPIVDEEGNLVAVVGVSEDVTTQRRLEQRAEDLAARLALALDAGGLGTWRWNLQTGETDWDNKVEQLFGLGPGEFDGSYESYVSLLHPEDAPEVLATVEEAVKTKSAYVVDHRVVWPDGSVHWLQGKGRAIVDDDGEVLGTIGCVADVTEQMQALLEREKLTTAALEAAENERVSRERIEFLGVINDALSTATSRAEVMHNVTRAAVPRLGDWCSIFVLPDADSYIPDVDIAHVDPEMITYARGLQKRFPYDPDASTGIPAVIRTGHSEFFPEIDDAVIRQVDPSDEARDLVHELALRSAISVPLVKQGRILGAIQFVNVESSRRYTTDDLALAQAAAARIASSLEYIRLNEHQRKIATTLQASLLPAKLPDIPGVDIAVRYWATGEGTVVGGDFYDVFEVDDDHWAVVIGDVCGTGPAAAALTGLARHTIRASAWHGADHESVLRNVNNAVLRSGQVTFCTAVYGTLAHTRGGSSFEMASGGHPLPIIRRARGGTEMVGEPGTLLGAFPDSRSVTVTAQLAPGDTMLLYTDGVTDVAPPYDLGTETLCTMFDTSCASAASAGEVADRLGHELSSILPLADRHDDIALLVVRIAEPK
jgi:PAS domain S-box-containing protein